MSIDLEYYKERDLLLHEGIEMLLAEVELARQHNVPAIDLTYCDIDPNAVALVPRYVAERYLLVPLSRRGSVLSVAMADPSNLYFIDDVRFSTGFSVEAVVASESSLKEALARLYPEEVEIEQSSTAFHEEVVAPLLADCMEHALHIARKREPESYVVTVSGDESFEIRAKNLIAEAMRSHEPRPS